MRILVVEDDPEMARFITRGLTEQAYAVDAVGSGEAAIERATTTPYDAILLVAMIPPPDGFEFCRSVRRDGWIAEAHGGKLWLETSDAGGSMFVATLPRLQAESASSDV